MRSQKYRGPSLQNFRERFQERISSESKHLYNMILEYINDNNETKWQISSIFISLIFSFFPLIIQTVCFSHHWLQCAHLLYIDPNRLKISSSRRHRDILRGTFRSLGYHSTTLRVYSWTFERIRPSIISAVGILSARPSLSSASESPRFGYAHHESFQSHLDRSPHLVLFTNPSARAGYDTRSIFKRSLTGLNSEFSFS